MVRETAKENQVALFGFFEGFTRSTPVVFLLIILPQLLASIIEGGPTDLNLGITLAILPLWLVLPLERRLSGKSKKCLGIILAYGGSVLLLLTGILYLVQWSVDDTPALTLVILTAACLSLLAFQDLDYFGMLEQVPRRRFSAVLGMGIAGLVFALIYLLTGTVAALFFV